MNRRQTLLLAALAGSPLIATLFRSSPAWSQGIDVKAVLNDPDAPETGNPKGDVTIVAYFDYNCPFCKKAEPDLARAVKDDRNVRLVYKDWPILTDASMYGAQLALGAKYQGKYHEVHDALMAIPGRKIAKEKMLEAVKATSVDVERLAGDMKTRAPEIVALLQRNLSQAEAMGLQGTPVYLIGPYKVAETLDYDGFKGAIQKARSAHKK